MQAGFVVQQLNDNELSICQKAQSVTTGWYSQILVMSAELISIAYLFSQILLIFSAGFLKCCKPLQEVFLWEFQTILERWQFQFKNNKQTKKKPTHFCLMQPKVGSSILKLGLENCIRKSKGTVFHVVVAMAPLLIFKVR